MDKRKQVGPLTEGTYRKGGQNPPNTNTQRPPPPKGSGGAARATDPNRGNVVMDALIAVGSDFSLTMNDANKVYDAVVAEERERCAKIAEASYFRDVGVSIASAIRE